MDPCTKMISQKWLAEMSARICQKWFSKKRGRRLDPCAKMIFQKWFQNECADLSKMISQKEALAVGPLRKNGFPKRISKKSARICQKWFSKKEAVTVGPLRKYDFPKMIPKWVRGFVKNDFPERGVDSWTLAQKWFSKKDFQKVRGFVQKWFCEMISKNNCPFWTFCPAFNQNAEKLNFLKNLKVWINAARFLTNTRTFGEIRNAAGWIGAFFGQTNVPSWGI